LETALELFSGVFWRCWQGIMGGRNRGLFETCRKCQINNYLADTLNNNFVIVFEPTFSTKDAFSYSVDIGTDVSNI
jgi:hypothetical protein